MDVKSLQIGDYVNYRGQIIKVTSLYDKGGSNEVGWSNKESVWVNADNVEPITLTQEILEKNGFEKWDDGWCIYDQENTGIEVAWVGTILKISGDYANLELPAVMYVHQLQHALRLCGISKEIVL